MNIAATVAAMSCLTSSPHVLSKERYNLKANANGNDNSDVDADNSG